MSYFLHAYSACWIVGIIVGAYHDHSDNFVVKLYTLNIVYTRAVFANCMFRYVDNGSSFKCKLSLSLSLFLSLSPSSLCS